MLDVTTAMRRAAVFHSDRPAVVCGDITLTYAEAWERGLRLANWLGSMGVAPGDRVAVLEDNCLESSDFFLGAVAGNFVRVPLYRRNARDSHANMLRQTQCKVLVVASEYLHEVDGLQGELPDLQHIIVRDETYAERLGEWPSDDPRPAVSLDDFHLIRHSAGTTGKSKGIPFTHRQWMSTERDYMASLPVMEVGDACHHSAPISHGSGYLFVPFWMCGGVNILDPKFDPERMLHALSTIGGWLWAAPTMISDMVRAAEGQHYTFPRLKAIVISAAPIRPSTALAGHQLFGDTLYQLYGQTEAVPAAIMGSNDWFGDIPGSEPLLAAGRLTPFAEVEIRDEDNQPLPLGTPGEIAIRCDGQTSGIWGEPEITRRRILDGWVLTGDIGRLDANGFLYILDRKDDMIISGGFNIWPLELEVVIAELPGVREAAVFGVPHRRWGETPLAVVVCDDDAAVSEETVIETCRERLGSYKKPTQVIFQSSPLPRSPVGKVLRRALREQYVSPADSPEPRAIAGA